jgi:hypothetical protein
MRVRFLEIDGEGLEESVRRAKASRRYLEKIGWTVEILAPTFSPLGSHRLHKFLLIKALTTEGV